MRGPVRSVPIRADLDSVLMISERTSTSGFPHYRDASSSSLTTGSGSSLASSTGGLHMNVPMTPLTPIPVMITGPDGSLRRESMQSMQPDAKQPVFYTQNEVHLAGILLLIGDCKFPGIMRRAPRPIRVPASWKRIEHRSRRFCDSCGTMALRSDCSRVL